MHPITQKQATLLLAHGEPTYVQHNDTQQFVPLTHSIDSTSNQLYADERGFKQTLANGQVHG